MGCVREHLLRLIHARHVDDTWGLPAIRQEVEQAGNGLATVERHLPRTTKLLLGCQSGMRSQRACELLSEAGFPNGFKTVLWLGNQTEAARTGEFIQPQLAQVGVNAQLVPMEAGTIMFTVTPYWALSLARCLR